jgi:alkyl hydroperoxide reductase subunit AhpC
VPGHKKTLLDATLPGVAVSPGRNLGKTSILAGRSTCGRDARPAHPHIDLARMVMRFASLPVPCALARLASFAAHPFSGGVTRDSSNGELHMATLRLGDIAPDFEQQSSEGPIHFHQWLGDSWGVLYSHPADFTPVCTTELGFTAKLGGEFKKRNVKVIALSVDPVEQHKKWIEDINDTQKTKVNFPIIADADRKVSLLYDLIHPNASATATVRSVFVIDPQKKIRLTLTYPASTGRNFDEILRVIDSLQLTDSHSVATPANWKDGDPVVIVPSLQDPEVLKAKFPKGWDPVRPYLRITPQPNK